MVRTELNCRRTISCRRPTTTGAGRTASPVSPADGLPYTASDSTSTVRTAQFTPPHQTTQDGPVCVVSGACQLSRPDRRTSAFSVGVRPAVALRRPTHSDAERTCRAVSSQRHARRDKTVLSVSCRVWRCELVDCSERTQRPTQRPLYVSLCPPPPPHRALFVLACSSTHDVRFSYSNSCSSNCTFVPGS